MLFVEDRVGSDIVARLESLSIWLLWNFRRRMMSSLMSKRWGVDPVATTLKRKMDKL